MTSKDVEQSWWWRRSTSLRLKALNGAGTAWILTWAVICIDALGLFLAGWSISWSGVLVTVLALAAFLVPLGIKRYRNDLRISSTTRAAALLVTFMSSASVLSYLVISTNAPLIDAKFAAWDAALGLDWLALHSWLQGQTFLKILLSMTYQSGLIQLAFVVIFLGFSKLPEKLDEFMLLFISATLFTIVFSGFFPAEGPWKYYASGGHFDLSSLSHFEFLRNGGMKHIPLSDMQGLIVLPSLHAAMAVLFVYAMRGSTVFVPSLILNLCMLVSTPVDGGHYFVDVLAGVALAVGLIALSYWLEQRPSVMQAAKSTQGLGAVQ